MKLTNIFSALILILVNIQCRDDEDKPPICGPYPNWENSEYVLPFPVGNKFRISQGNCADFTYQNTLKHSYGIEMPFGSVVTAARAGVVFGIRISQPAGSRGETDSNWIQIIHDDGEISEYIHLEQGSARVTMGHFVKAGDTLALTGDTGYIGAYPHLLFDINRCGNNFACETLPVTFRNTKANPNGLIFNQRYEALSYTSRGGDF